MPALPDLSISQVLRTSARTSLCRGVTREGKRVLLKSSTVTHPGKEDIALFRNDYNLGRKLSARSSRVLRPQGLEVRGDALILLSEDFGGVPLSASLDAPLPLSRFLGVGIGICEALRDIHDNGVIHGSICPRSILLHPETDEIKIADFDHASRGPEMDREAMIPGEGGLDYAYMSPEQTGRMNLGIDWRTDFYSLGIVFYEMLAGKQPFTAKSALQWFHAHMALTPLPLSALDPTIPHVLSEIVSKLLRKMVDDRYQSARGLLFDLQRCRQELARSGHIPSFPLGSRDKSSQLSVPRRLYGREAELGALVRDFEESLTADKVVLTLISGYSGVGKTSLAQELVRATASRNGFFASGKFGQQAKNAPYSTISAALRGVVLEIVAGGEEAISLWRQRLLEGVSDNIPVLAKVLPDIALLLGDSPSAAWEEESSPAETERRMLGSIQAFINLLSSPDHPLTLFLDDLQWADSATLRLLEFLVTGQDSRRFFLIGAYRENETGPTHPLTDTIQRIRSSGGRIHELRLAPLRRPDVEKLVADALHESPRDVTALAEHIFAKTGGNPFFALQFLKSIFTDGLLRLNGDTCRWTWESARIASADYTDSAIDLMIQVIGKLPAGTKTALAFAALMGTKFSAETLAGLCGLGVEEARDALQEAVQLRLVLRGKEDTYVFQHDRIQQAAYLLTPPGRRAGMHVRIARALLEEASPASLQERIFDVVTQFNAGIPEISSPAEKREVASLNLMAGRKAKSAAAYDAAADFLSTGLSLLGENPWRDHYRLAYELNLEAAECIYLTGRFEEAEKKLEDILLHAEDPLEKARAYKVRLSLCTTKGEMSKAVSVGLEALGVLGMALPPRPTQAEVTAAYDAIWLSLRGRDIESLIDLPLMKDQHMLAALRVLGGLLLPAHFAGGGFNRLVTAQMLSISISHGINSDSVLAFSWFAATLVDRSVGRYSEGYRFGRLSYDLMKRHGYTACKSRVCLFFGDIVNFYTRHLKEDRAFILEGFDAGVAHGDLLSACYHCNHLITNMLAAADPLEQVWQESQRRLDFVRKAKDPNIECILLSQQRFIRNLQGKTISPLSFSDSELDEAQFESHIDKSEMTLMKFWYYVLKMKARFIFGDYASAAEAAFIARRHSHADQFDMESTQYFFFSALALASHHEHVDEARKKEYLSIILAHLEQLRAWRDSCPQNFESQFFLVAAELGRLRGQTAEAMLLYEKAVQSAEANGFTHSMAVACELAGRFHQSLGLTLSAAAFRRKALHGYRLWGADGKVAELCKGIRLPETPDPTVQVAAEASQPFSVLVDLGAVTQAQRAISSELLPENLHKAILRIALENAGAQKGALVLCHENELTLAAELEEGHTKTMAIPLENARSLPKSLVEYVARVKSSVLFNDARRPHLFSRDEYFVRRQPVSVLCLPVVRQNELRAIIYLENNLVTHSFPSGRLEVLEMLASQAAISIENSYLYENLRVSVRARDEFMAIASHELKSPLSSVSVYVQTLKRILQKGELSKYPQSELLKLLEASSGGVKRLAALIDQLLDASRSTLGALKVHREPADLSAIVRETIDRFQAELLGARCPLELDLAPSIVGSWDRLRIEQVVANLLSNAIKYAAGKPIAIKTRLKDGAAALVVEDRGIGISPKDQKRLFRPFERAVPYRSVSGFGLGLYIVKKIVEAHEGSIELRSEPGRGTTLLVELPLRPASSAEDSHAAG